MGLVSGTIENHWQIWIINTSNITTLLSVAHQANRRRGSLIAYERPLPVKICTVAYKGWIFFLCPAATSFCSGFNFLKLFVPTFTFWGFGYILEVPPTVPGEWKIKEVCLPPQRPFFNTFFSHFGAPYSFNRLTKAPPYYSCETHLNYRVVIVLYIKSKCRVTGICLLCRGGVEVKSEMMKNWNMILSYIMVKTKEVKKNNNNNHEYLISFICHQILFQPYWQGCKWWL